MKTYIALLRGINVGGHKKVPMAELRDLLGKTGFADVTTYIQSGNVVFKTSIDDQSTLENQIKKAIFEQFGFEVSVMVRTRHQLLKIFEDCPFPEEQKVDSYFAILSSQPDAQLVGEASQKTYENEEYHIINDCLYLYCANGYGKAKFNLSFFEKKLRVSATSRNYKTMMKLIDISQDV